MDLFGSGMVAPIAILKNVFRLGPVTSSRQGVSLCVSTTARKAGGLDFPA